MNRIWWLVVASALVAGGPLTAPVDATPELFAEARKQGLPAKNCQYCHVSQTPQKGSYTPDDLNDRGKWLMTAKDRQQARDVKADWLGQYPGGKEQK